MWKVKSAAVSAVMLLGFTLLHFVAHGYTRLESLALGHFQASKRALISDLATNLGYVPVSEPEEELSPQILCTMEAVRRDINPSLACSLLLEESGGDPFAVSPKGAVGLTQIMPANVRRCGECGVKTRNDLFDTGKNVCCGVLLFDEDLKSHNDDPARALEAYNGGPSAVKAIRKCGDSNAKCLGGFTESVNHRNKVLRRVARATS